MGKRRVIEESSEMESSKSQESTKTIKDIPMNSKEIPMSSKKSKIPKDKTIQKPKKVKISKEKNKIDFEAYARALIDNMKEIYQIDLESSMKGKPAVQKIENISLIASRIQNKQTQDTCIKMGLLNEIRVWLEPLRDNSLPNNKIKKELLDVLNNISVSKYDLLSSQIGKIIHFYAKNNRETIEIRRAAKAVMSKWKAGIIKEEQLAQEE